MAIRYVYPGSTTGSGTSASPWTMAQANAGVGLGDTIKIAGGTYSVAPKPAISGTSTAGIIYEAQTSTRPIFLAAPMSWNSLSYITLRQLTFRANKTSWFTIDANSHRITMTECLFDSVENKDYDHPFWGGRFQGNFIVFSRNEMGVFGGGDALQFWGERNLIEYNDFNFGDSGHGPVMCHTEFSVIRGNYIRCKWSRAGHTVSNVAKQGLRNVYEDNIIFDTGLVQKNYNDGANEGYEVWGWSIPHPNPNGNGTTVNPEGAGDQQVYKTGGTGTIMRNNLMLACNGPWEQPDPSRYSCVFHIGNYNNQFADWARQRHYHNTFYDNDFHAYGFTYSTDPNNLPYRCTDIRFLNNIMHRNGKIFTGGTAYKGGGGSVEYPHAFFSNNTAAGQLNTYQWHGNLMTDRVRIDPSVYTTTSAFQTALGSRASNNILDLNISPAFINPDYSAAMVTNATKANRITKVIRDNFLLANGSVGENVAVPLARITQAGTNVTRLTVSDAWVFSDGNGVIDGDELNVNGDICRVTAWVNETQIDVTPAITVANNDPIWLVKYGVGGDLGIRSISTATVPNPPSTQIAAPTLAHAAVVSTTAGVGITSPTFAPPANSLLIISATANGSASGVTILPATITDTFSGGALSWTQYSVERGTTGSRVAEVVFVARTGPTPGSGNYTVAWGNEAGNKVLNASVITTGFATPPVVQSAVGDVGSVTDFTVTLAAAPAATSLAIGFLAARGTGPAITHDPETVELAETLAGTNHAQQIQYILGGSAADMTWSGTLGAAGNAAIVLEIAEGAAVEYMQAAVTGALGAITATGQAAHTVPTFTAVAAGTLGALTASGVGRLVSTEHSAIVSGALGGLTATGVATYTERYSATVTGILPALTASGVAACTPPTFSASGDATLGALVVAATAAHELPTFSASVAVSLAPIVGQAVAVSAVTIFESSVHAALSALTASGVASHSPPEYIAFVEGTLASLEGESIASFNSDSVVVLGKTYFIATAFVEI